MSEACFWWGRPVLLKVLPKEDKGEARVHVYKHTCFYTDIFFETTEIRLHRDAFTHRNVFNYRQILVHREDFTQRNFTHR